MDVKLLIDAIVPQATVLIAQLSTSAGIRAPLSHIADQVFLDLAAEIEAEQGSVTRERLFERFRHDSADDVAAVLSDLVGQGVVFDHFSAVARAIAAKVRHGASQSGTDDVIGGATLTFELSAAHPSGPRCADSCGACARR